MTREVARARVPTPPARAVSTGPDPTGRFSDRAASYDLGRPGYPAGILAVLEAEGVLEPASRIADVGAGTGILTRLLMDHGHAVVAVEPNPSMRRVAERELGSRPGFRSLAGRAEATGLPDASVDLVIAAQAGHWFDLAAARTEFTRILRPGGYAAFVWNERRTSGTPFLEAYEAFLRRWGTDYGEVRARWTPSRSLETLYGRTPAAASLDNRQVLDPAGLHARVVSSSYMPAEDDPDFEAMTAALDRLFDAHQREGRVVLEYDTNLYWGRPAPPTSPSPRPPPRPDPR